MEILPERHLECSDCKKPIHTIYTELVGKSLFRLSMCRDCPILRQKMQGGKTPTTTEEALALGLCCGNCQTTADEVKMGGNTGCSLCYEVFDEIIHQEIFLKERLPERAKRNKHPIPMHLGRGPGEPTVANPATKLLALHQALHETLAQEDYEAAAWLRDQIKALTEENQSQNDSDEHQ